MLKITVCAALVQNQLQLYLILISLGLSKRTNLSHAAQRCNFMFNMTKRMLDTIHPCTAHCSSQHSTTTSWWSLQNCFSYRNKGHLWDPNWTELSSSSKVPSTSQNNSLATSLSLLADRAYLSLIKLSLQQTPVLVVTKTAGDPENKSSMG